MHVVQCIALQTFYTFIDCKLLLLWLCFMLNHLHLVLSSSEGQQACYHRHILHEVFCHCIDVTGGGGHFSHHHVSHPISFSTSVSSVYENTESSIFRCRFIDGMFFNSLLIMNLCVHVKLITLFINPSCFVCCSFLLIVSVMFHLRHIPPASSHLFVIYPSCHKM